MIFQRDENFLSVGNAGGDESIGGDIEGAECRQALKGGTTFTPLLHVCRRMYRTS